MFCLFECRQKLKFRISSTAKLNYCTAILPTGHRITDWFTASKLTVSIGKCEAISFGNGLPEKITILNKELCYKSSCKYLVLHLDGSLKFREHITYVVKKLNNFCGLIYRLRDLYPRKCLLMFYNSFARSIISYGILVYGSAAKTSLKKN